MKANVLLFGVLFVLALSTIWVLRIKEGQCRWCSSFTCYSSATCGGSGCVCIKPMGSLSGYCASIERQAK